LSAYVTPTGNLNTGQFTIQMSHSSSGPTAVVTGYCDIPSTGIIISNIKVTTGICSLRTIDGVPSLTSGDQIRTAFSGSGMVSAFYSNPIAQLSSSMASTVNVPPTGSPPSGQQQILSGVELASFNVYSTGIVVGVSVYNSQGTATSSTSTTNFRIDTVSNQQLERRTAGTGQYPTSNYGNTYSDLTSLTGNEELQLINGLVQYPPRVNYSGLTPSGPNYTNLPSGILSGYRWELLNFGSISNVSNIQVFFTGASNFGTSPLVSGLLLYANVSGGTNGWIDGNAAYPGVGNPTNNGDPALVVASSSSTGKLITFGSTALSGPVYIRIGLPTGSTKSFTTVGFSTA